MLRMPCPSWQRRNVESVKQSAVLPKSACLQYTARFPVQCYINKAAIHMPCVIFILLLWDGIALKVTKDLFFNKPKNRSCRCPFAWRNAILWTLTCLIVFTGLAVGLLSDLENKCILEVRSSELHANVALKNWVSPSFSANTIENFCAATCLIRQPAHTLFPIGL